MLPELYAGFYTWIWCFEHLLDQVQAFCLYLDGFVEEFNFLFEPTSGFDD